jgi:hypothetical protein
VAKAAGGVVRNQPGHRASPVHDRYDFLPRKVWDDKNPDVRQFLLEQYAGRCQICTATFPKRDGNPYFEILYLVSHTSAAWIDRPGDVLCLCPTCISSSSTEKYAPTTSSTRSAHGGPAPRACSPGPAPDAL